MLFGSSIYLLSHLAKPCSTHFHGYLLPTTPPPQVASTYPSPYHNRRFPYNLAAAAALTVKQESPASVAGLCADDVIISCDGKSIGSQLELIETLWNKEGKAVELVVVRPETGQRRLTVTIGTSPKMNKWHVPLVGFLPTLEDRLAVERRDKMKVDEME